MKGSVGGGTEIHVAGAGFAYVTQAPKNSGKNYSEPSPPVGSGHPPKNSLIQVFGPGVGTPDQGKQP